MFNDRAISATFLASWMGLVVVPLVDLGSAKLEFLCDLNPHIQGPFWIFMEPLEEIGALADTKSKPRATHSALFP